MKSLMKLTTSPLALLENLGNAVVAIALVAMMALVTMEAATRYLFDSPSSGVLPITETFLMPAVVFLGWARTQRDYKHVSVGILQPYLPQTLRRVLATTVLVISAALFSVVLWTAVEQAERAWGQWTVASPSLPVGPSRTLVVVGAALIVLRLLAQTVDVWARPSEPATDSEGVD